MSIKVYWLSAWRTPTKWSVYWLSAWREIQRIQIWRTDPTTGLVGWREIYRKSGTSPPPPPAPAPPPPPPPPPASLSVAITPSSDTKTIGNNGSTATITSHTLTAAATGGTGPYTYHWELVSYDPNPNGPPTATSPDAATTTIEEDITPDDVLSSQWKVTAADTLGNVGTAYINVALGIFNRLSNGGL